MNKIILGATFVAIAALVGTPILAEAIIDLNGVRVQMDNAGDYKSIVFKTLDAVPTDGLVFGGYAIPTSGDFIAVTSHLGFLDSEAQVGEFDAIWHSHLVKASKNTNCDNVAIDALSFEEPTESVVVRGEGSSNILLKTIANGDVTYFDEISQRDLLFTVGNPIDIVPVRQNSPSGVVESIAFDLNVAADGTICIGEVISNKSKPK